MDTVFRVPAATYRLQFNTEFRFSDARDLSVYLNQLGISDVYASPVFMARKGSRHGYDVIDPTRLNPELGSEAEFESMVKEFQRQNLGLLLDIVPNHMAVSPENPFWMDLLEKGQASRYTSFFDIEWVECDGAADRKVILPVLGKPYGQALEDQEIVLRLENSALFIHYYETRLPVAWQTYPLVLSYRLESPEVGLKLAPREVLRLKQIMKEMNSWSLSNTSFSPEAEARLQSIKEEFSDLLDHSSGIRDFLQENVALINGEKGNPRSFDRLDELLGRQVYRLSFWRTGRDEMNFRRFFDINNLIGVRVELPEVLQETHSLVFRLVSESTVTGLRIDHIDGLYNPQEYLDSLRRYLGRVYIVVEKILTGDELLPSDWAAQGTTGYDFAREVNGVFVDLEGLAKLDAHYTRVINRATTFADVVYEKKKQVIVDLFSGEIRLLGCQLHALAERDRYARDLSENDLIQTLTGVTAGLPVYRTYTRSYEVSPVDRRYLEFSLREARRREPLLEETALDFMRRVLNLEFPVGLLPELKQRWLQWVMRWQQFTGPVTAKGLEDTALYNYNRLVSLNVIGASLKPLPLKASSSPDLPVENGLPDNRRPWLFTSTEDSPPVPNRFPLSAAGDIFPSSRPPSEGTGTRVADKVRTGEAAPPHDPLVERFHRFNRDRQQHWPLTLNATSTHDTKRSEDVNARINVLSEMPRPWTAHLSFWRRVNYNRRQKVGDQMVPEPNTEELLYQSLVGAWPLSPGEVPGFKERFKTFMLKAVREAKVFTNWIRPNEKYEAAVTGFIDSILEESGENEFLPDFLSFQKQVAFYGAINSLGQVLLKITSPGIPDFYQGTELWDFSLVDPDNRRPVDYSRRKALLDDLAAGEKQNLPALIQDMLKHWQDGRVKLYTIYKALKIRRANQDLFQKGDYIPLAADGRRNENVTAFLRRWQNRWVLTAVPRLTVRLVEARDYPVEKRIWRNEGLVLPDGAPRQWRNIFTGENVEIEARGSYLPLARVFNAYPVSLLAAEN